MKYPKSKLFFGISAAILLVTGATTMVLSSDAAGEELSPGQIFKQTQEAYALMASYGDEGQIVTIRGDTTNTTVFNIRLARTNFYRIEWEQHSQSSSSASRAGAQVVWSSGAGDFLETGYGPQAKWCREVALAQAGGAAATVPLIFFNPQRGGQENEPAGSGLSGDRQVDEKLGETDCYVFAQKTQDLTKTLWIGKQDFLIHQVQTVSSAEAMQDMLARAKVNPELVDALRKSGSLAFTSTESHNNIVINRPFMRSDFVPSFPSYSPRNSE